MIQSQTEKMFIDRASNFTELNRVYTENNGNTGIINNRLNNIVLAYNCPYKYITLMIIWNLILKKRLNLSEIFKRFTVGPKTYHL